MSLHLAEPVISSVDHCSGLVFWNFILCQKHLEGLLTHRLLPLLKSGAEEFAFQQAPQQY